MADDPLDDWDSITDYIKHEIRKYLDEDFYKNHLGPAIYGEGNYEVYLTDHDSWAIRPVEGWEPAELKGIFDMEGVEIVYEIEPITLQPTLKRKENEDDAGRVAPD